MPGVLHQRRNDGLEQRAVLLDEIKPGFPRVLSRTRRDDDQIRPRRDGVVDGGADLRAGEEGGGVLEMQVAYSLQSTASYGSMKYAQIAELLNGKQNISLEPGGQFELSGEVNSYLYQILILLVHHKILGLMQKLNVKSQTDPEISQNTLNS
nr:glutamate--cysteine ligase, chloroplastic-like [Ipomoea batatas]